MIIIRGKAGTGRLNELVKRFRQNTDAELVTNELSPEDLTVFIQDSYLKVPTVVSPKVNITELYQYVIESQFTNIYISAMNSLFTGSKLVILNTLRTIEKEYNKNITLAVQLPVNDGTEGLVIEEYK